ncbi:hypothetical protein FFWV33_13815 [Flavobacterium faecale]|uniref:Uncharacterized protein n=1 Tax=Flavobacterium faecale TaxID=1355330 RepID=A0A2S1LG59_9FLAO|nr:hypothetical protein [Flavobacterium faecale]AWG22526.1 hypothetical protein FFWV33_13815 [Flavobacterium faecale]
MKLFRNLRRKLVVFSKFKSYLIYAIGEVILITIGISIAWKINNWNDIRKDTIVERKIYMNLNEELHSNLRLLNRVIDEYPERIKYLENTLNYVGKDEKDLSQGAKDTIVNLFDTDTNLIENSVTSIVQTSKFELLESNDLKDLIILYPNKLVKFKEQNENIKTLVNVKIKPIIEQYISLADKLPNDNKYKTIKTYGSKSDYIGLLSNKKYQNAIIGWILQIKKQLENAKTLRGKTKVLCTNLNEELN